MSLYELERSGDVQEIINVLRTSDNPKVRKRAAELLANFADHDDYRDVVNALVETARDDDQAPVVATAVDSLSQLGQDALESLIAEVAGVELGDDQAEWVKAKAFVNALDADVPELRMAAANGLGNIEQSDAVEPLVASLDDGDPRVRARVARALGEIADPRATDALQARLNDDYAGVRRAAAGALGNVGNRQALQALLPLYADDDERVRRVAVNAFGNFENGKPVEHLIDALGDDTATVRRTAVYSLIQLLSNVPTDQSHDIRETIVDELQDTDDESVIVPLVEILEESQQAAQRRNTAWLLGRVVDAPGPDRVVTALVDALESDDQMTPQFAATSLAEIGGERVEDALIEVVEDESIPSSARAQAVFTLGKVGGERSRQLLDDLVDDAEDEQVRKKAFSALSKLGGRT